MTGYGVHGRPVRNASRRSKRFPTQLALRLLLVFVFTLFGGTALAVPAVGVSAPASDHDCLAYAYDGGAQSVATHAASASPVAPEASSLATQEAVVQAAAALSVLSRLSVAANSGVWSLPSEGGGLNIGGRWYTEHALERIAPNTPEVMAQLEARAIARAQAEGISPGTPEFGAWWNKYGPDPRGIPTMVVEAEIANPGTTGVRVITNANGDVVTVIPTG